MSSDGLIGHPLSALKQAMPFRYGFENVSYSEEEFDARLGTPGLHDVRPRVERDAREKILPPDLASRYEGAQVWRDPAFNMRRVRILDRAGATGRD